MFWADPDVKLHHLCREIIALLLIIYDDFANPG